MPVIPRALENPSFDGGFWQIRTFAATWLNGMFWSETVGSRALRLPKEVSHFQVGQMPSLWKKTLLRISASAWILVQLRTSMYSLMLPNHWK
jgi:hypothetical protein